MAELQSMLIVPDTHAPYHDQRAWELMMKVARANKPDMIIILGDFADFYAVSSYSKDPRRCNQLDEEVEAVRELLDELGTLGAKRKVFIAGNHCDRLERYLAAKAPELFGVTSTPKVLELKKRGWEYVPYKDDIKIGCCYFTHDVGTSTGRPSAFKTLDVYQHSNVTGHTHRINYVVEGNALGEAMVSAQFGWLGDTSQIDYLHKIKALKDWSLGFGWGYLRPSNGFVYLQPIPIVDYSCVVGGRLYTVGGK